MDFSEALIQLKLGNRIRRKHWSGYWFIPEFTAFGDFHYGDGLDGSVLMTTVIIAYKPGVRYMPAEARQEDILAIDWEVI